MKTLLQKSHFNLYLNTALANRIASIAVWQKTSKTVFAEKLIEWALQQHGFLSGEFPLEMSHEDFIEKMVERMKKAKEKQRKSSAPKASKREDSVTHQ